jgi:hypothetical protein
MALTGYPSNTCLCACATGHFAAAFFLPAVLCVSEEDWDRDLGLARLPGEEYLRLLDNGSGFRVMTL